MSLHGGTGSGSGGGGGASNFADLLDLTTAVVPEINIVSNTDGIIWKSRDGATVTRYGSHYSFADTTTQYAGMDAASATQYAVLEVKADEANTTSYFSESGAREVYNATYSGATAALLGGYVHHVFTANPGGSVTVNKAKIRDLFYVTNKSGVDITFIQNTVETFDGATSVVVPNSSAALFIAARAGGLYQVFYSGLQTSVSGNAGTVTVADAGADTTTWPMLATSQTGNLAPATDAGLTYNANTNALTATTFVGALTGAASDIASNFKIRPIGVTIDGGASAPAVNASAFIFIPYACTITEWTIGGDISGSAVVDVLTATYGNRGSEASIAGSEKPTLSSVIENRDTNLTTWTPTIAAGTWVQFKVGSASTLTKIYITLKAVMT